MTDQNEPETRANQRVLVIEEFRRSGRVDAHMMWTRGISRLASIIWRLRKEWGHDSIETIVGGKGEMAVYILKRPPDVWFRPRRTPAGPKGWFCSVCGQRTLYLDVRLTPTRGKSHCGPCNKVNMFRLRGA